MGSGLKFLTFENPTFLPRRCELRHCYQWSAVSNFNNVKPDPFPKRGLVSWHRGWDNQRPAPVPRNNVFNGTPPRTTRRRVLERVSCIANLFGRPHRAACTIDQRRRQPGRGISYQNPFRGTRGTTRRFVRRRSGFPLQPSVCTSHSDLSPESASRTNRSGADSARTWRGRRFDRARR